MNANKTRVIPEINIEHYVKSPCGFLITTLEDFQIQYPETFTNSYRVMHYQFVFIEQGDLILQIDANRKTIEGGTLFAISKGNVINVDFAGKVKGYVIMFTEEFVCKYSGDFAWITNLRIFDNSSNIVLLRPDKKEYEELLFLLNKMQSDFNDENDFAKDDILINSLKTFILKSERLIRKNSNHEGVDTVDLRYFVQFKELLEMNFGNSRSVNFYANSLNITCKKLNQLTTKYWGKSAKQVIEERVLLETKRLLIHTCQSIKEIGNTLGFVDPTNFNKFFKKYAKVTPAEFRTVKKEDLYHKTSVNNHL